MAARSTITPQEDEELRLLRAEYFDASKRAAEAMQTSDHPLDVAALKTVLEEDARAGKAMRRFKEIYGV
jgi:urease gamma subunit